MSKFLDDRRIWAVLLGILVVLEIVWLSFNPSVDPDTWWHLKTGEIIWQTHTIPRVDSYSYVIGGKPWVTFEWLSQLTFYLAYLLGGAAALVWLKAAVIATAFLLFFRLAGGGPWAAVLLCFTGILDIDFFLSRPQIFDYLFLSLFLTLILRRLQTRQEERLGSLWWQFPLMQILWVNLHGGAAIVGVGVTAVCAVTRERRKQATPWALLSLACFAAMFLNPHGWRIFANLYDNMTFSSRSPIPLIMEWAPMWSSPWRPGIAFLCVGLAAVPFSWKKDRFLSALCLVFAAMAISSIRHMSLFSFIAASLAARALDRRWPLTIGWRPAAAAITAVALACGLAARRHAYFAKLGHVEFRDPPDRAIQFLDDHHVDGRMFHSYGFGGYLIWKTYPRRKVFVDGRNVEYGPDFIRKVAFWFVPNVFEELDREWNFDYAILENDTHYNAIALDASPRWALVFWDDTALVYLKREPQNDKLIRQYGYHWLKPNQLDYNYLGPMLQDPKIRPQVMEEIERSIRESYKNDNAYELRAMVLLQMQRYQEAVRDLEWVTQRLPTNPGPLMSLAWCYELMRDYEKARDYYVKAAAAAHRQDDVRAEAYLDNNIGAVDFKLGRRDEAEQMFRRCLKLWPSHREARQNLIRIGAVP